MRFTLSKCLTTCKLIIHLKVSKNTIGVTQIHGYYIWNFIKIQQFWLLPSGFERRPHPDVIVLICLFLGRDFTALAAWGTQSRASWKLPAGPGLLPSPSVSICFHKDCYIMAYIFIIATIVPVKKYSEQVFSLFSVFLSPNCLFQLIKSWQPIPWSHLWPPFLWNKFLTQSRVPVNSWALFEWKLDKMYFDSFSGLEVVLSGGCKTSWLYFHPYNISFITQPPTLVNSEYWHHFAGETYAWSTKLGCICLRSYF